jgi:hypothetical protein
MVLPMGTTKLPTTAVLLSQENGPLVSDASANQQKEHDDQVKKVKAYFADRHLPGAQYAEQLVTESEKNGIDWALLPSIMMIESTGCKHMYNQNCFGWGSAKIPFASIEEGIKIVAWNLGGNNPNTAKYYKGKTTEQILDMYNPPSIVAEYSGNVRGVMKTIKNYPIPETTVATSSDPKSA